MSNWLTYHTKFKVIINRGTLVAHLVKYPTLAQVHGFKPLIGLCADSSESGACFRFSVSLCLSKINI